MASVEEFSSPISSNTIELELQNDQDSFSTVHLELDPEKGKKKKVPKRVLHFSDGTIEEYSTDEEVEEPPKPAPVDTKTLRWGPWAFYQVTTAASKSLQAADYLGEKLAWFFGITSPKYQYAIDEYEKMKAEEEEEQNRLVREAEAKVQRETADMTNLEDGFSAESANKVANGVNGGFPGVICGQKQGIDNPALKY